MGILCVQAVTRSAGVIAQAVSTQTALLDMSDNHTGTLHSHTYDPFFHSRVKKDQDGANVTRQGLFSNSWDEDGKCVLSFLAIFLASFIMFSLATVVICYSYG